jgi:hypothetical protein
MRARGALLLAVVSAGCAAELRRPFADRPVAWVEHDDEDMARPPESSGDSTARIAIGMLNLLVREANRVLSIEWRRPADDVNALDEVPCSSWFCARNHLEGRLTPAAVAAGPPAARAPVLPLTILAGNEAAAERGLDATDRTGRRYWLKFDPPGHLGLVTGAEAVSQRLFWAAGYNAPGAFIVEVHVEDLRIAPAATILHHGYDEQPFTAAALDEILEVVPRTADGRIRAVAVATPAGKVVGAFDFIGTRDDDPNDRIPHQDRRSLRASRVLAAWIDAAGMSAADTQDVWVVEDGRHFVRHYFRDFSSAFGAVWYSAKGPWQGSEGMFDFAGVVQSLLLLGAYRRDWQDHRAEWVTAMGESTAVGWFPGGGWSPDSFRTLFPLPAHVRITERDAYWGAKLVTAFTDEQIHAAVGAGGYSALDATRLELALRVRRDAIGRKWLTRLSAIERPELSRDGRDLCFGDMAIERGAARVGTVLYGVLVDGGQRWLPALGARTCLPLPELHGDYVVVTILTRIERVLGRAARVHLAWRSGDGRYAVVGFERDE